MAFRDRTDAGLDGRTVGDPFGHEPGDPVIDRGGLRRGELDERPVDVNPAEDLADVELVASERARHLGVGLQEEPGPADER